MTDIIKYGATAKWLHWLVGVIVIVMLIAGRTLEALPISEREQIIMVHSALGTLILLLMAFRLFWRMGHKTPGPTATMGEWQTKLSNWMHYTLYVLLFLQPIFGIGQAMFITEYQVLAFGFLDYSSLAAANADTARIFHILHGLTATILSVLVIGHIGAGLYHHFMQKDDVLRRMLPYGKPSND